jgi:hypothetical protein
MHNPSAQKRFCPSDIQRVKSLGVQSDMGISEDYERKAAKVKLLQKRVAEKRKAMYHVKVMIDIIP